MHFIIVFGKLNYSNLLSGCQKNCDEIFYCMMYRTVLFLEHNFKNNMCLIWFEHEALHSCMTTRRW